MSQTNFFNTQVNPDKRLKWKSKKMSYLLRHNPEAENLDMDTNGWVFTQQLIKSISITMQELETIVTTDNKSRFEFNETKEKIRACQGHNLGLNIEYPIYNGEGPIFHGTSVENAKAILESGSIKPMTRDLVHFSLDINTAIKVGSRHGKPVVFKIDLTQARSDGIVFYKPTNNVVLCKELPAKYLSLLEGGKQYVKSVFKR